MLLLGCGGRAETSSGGPVVGGASGSGGTAGSASTGGSPGAGGDAAHAAASGGNAGTGGGAAGGGGTGTGGTDAGEAAEHARHSRSAARCNARADPACLACAPEKRAEQSLLSAAGNAAPTVRVACEIRVTLATSEAPARQATAFGERATDGGTCDSTSARQRTPDARAAHGGVTHAGKQLCIQSCFSPTGEHPEHPPTTYLDSSASTGGAAGTEAVPSTESGH